ncbi:hypothetical protein G6F65_021268 [Rhizopus arrhizus]|nr:hypothetical protein G6F65_021268 [Rhizopus arrhizus]
MSATKEVTIGTTIFRISRFDPFRQLKLLGDLQKEVLPAAGSMMAAVFGGEGEGQAKDEQAMLQAFRDLSTRLAGHLRAGRARSAKAERRAPRHGLLGFRGNPGAAVPRP